MGEIIDNTRFVQAALLHQSDHIVQSDLHSHTPTLVWARNQCRRLSSSNGSTLFANARCNVDMDSIILYGVIDVSKSTNQPVCCVDIDDQRCIMV